MTTYALKFLRADGTGPYTGFAWPLPQHGKPGKWVRAEGELEVCENGIHAVRLDEGALDHLDARCFIIELGGKVIWDEAERKYVARRGRLIREVTTWNARLYAHDCARHVLPIYEREHPGDTRVREALRVVRRYALGRASDEELAAAWDAAWAAAANAAAWAAARATAWATRAATGAAAYAAANAAERRWQLKRLRHYIAPPELATARGGLDAPEVES
jgi:hypothetical protein